MAEYTNLETIKFILNEVHQFKDVLGKGRFHMYDQEATDMFLDPIKAFSDANLFPFQREMDEKPAYYKDQAIHIHPQFEKIFQLSKRIGLYRLLFLMKKIGMQIPQIVSFMPLTI